MNKETEEEVWKTAQYLKNDGTMLTFPKYEVSSFGRVRSLNYGGHKGKVKLQKLIDHKSGYYHLNLYLNNNSIRCNIHRLVASTFLVLPRDSKMQVNHIDENKHNNKVENLEWCTPKYNVNYGTRNTRSSKILVNHPKISKSVLQIDPETNEIITEYSSAAEASRLLGYNEKAVCISIHMKCKCAGYIWKYK